MIAYKDVPRGGIKPGSDRLTQRQVWIWKWLLRFQQRRRIGASYKDVMSATGITSIHAVEDHVQALVRKGFAVCGHKHRHRTVVAVDPTFVPTEKGLAACR